MTVKRMDRSGWPRSQLARISFSRVHRDFCLRVQASPRKAGCTRRRTLVNRDGRIEFQTLFFQPHPRFRLVVSIQRRRM